MIYWIYITIISWFVALSLALALSRSAIYFSNSPIAFSTTLYILLSILHPQLFSLFPITIHSSMLFSLYFPVQLWLLLYSLYLTSYCVLISISVFLYLQSLPQYFPLYFSLNLSAYLYYFFFSNSLFKALIYFMVSLHLSIYLFISLHAQSPLFPFIPIVIIIPLNSLLSQHICHFSIDTC